MKPAVTSTRESHERPAAQLGRLIRSVTRASAADSVAVAAHIDSLTKPRGSLGRIESMALRLALIYGDPPPPLTRKTIFVLAGDHGVAIQGVSAYPREVTGQMCRNFAAGGAAISVFARAVGAEVVVADFGVDADLSDVAGIEQMKIRRGTSDLSAGRAMKLSEVRLALLQGAELFSRFAERSDVVGIGEMGIGNTTAAAALTAALTGADVAHVVGRGTGITDAALRRKQKIVREAVSRIPRAAGPLRILGQVGGLEIAGLAGVVIAAAAAKRALVVDGFIAAAAALAAVRLCPVAGDYLFASHRSREPGHAVLLDALALTPFLDLQMALGEGTGAALAMPVILSAANILREMATFETAGVSDQSSRL
jgi:nicotinate-nucleotide--dimethylbenzimidazole phosphoribosyltransferase